MAELELEIEQRIAAHTDGIELSSSLIERAHAELSRRRRRQRARAVIASSVVVAAVIVGAVVIAQRPGHRSNNIVISPVATPTPTPTPSKTPNLVAVAQSVLGSAYSLARSEPLSQWGGTKMPNIPGTVQRWRTSNGDVAQITWQPDNFTLDRANRPNGRTASGEAYHIQRAFNGQVEIVIFGGGNAVIYSVADLKVNPNDRKNGYMVTNLPSEKTLIRQAAELLAAS